MIWYFLTLIVEVATPVVIYIRYSAIDGIFMTCPWHDKIKHQNTQVYEEIKGIFYGIIRSSGWLCLNLIYH